MNHLFQYVFGPIYGIVPNIFSIVHRKIHHAYHGGYGDNISAWDCKRNSLIHFIWYTCRFYLHSLGITPVYYFYKYSNNEFNPNVKRNAMVLFLLDCNGILQIFISLFIIV